MSAGTLEITVNAANFKNMDTKAYGVSARVAHVKLEVVGTDQQHTTKKVPCPTLDPTWDEIFSFQITDPQTEKIRATFFLGDQQIGQPTEYQLNTLIKSKNTFKGLPVIGGKVDLSFRAIDFGQEEKKDEDEDGGFFDFL
eukprot:TRINITY_DN156_c0_g1_i1.p1 TRINITY_DN156_c0_g1~~TRINITY_DN156_c0_g1_i1.p1  ORF type:complete len:140 (-),score=29.48 TRINITY_DN156_c0_g1_i1:126-545(-)